MASEKDMACGLLVELMDSLFDVEFSTQALETGIGEIGVPEAMPHVKEVSKCVPGAAVKIRQVLKKECPGHLYDYDSTMKGLGISQGGQTGEGS